MPHPNIRDGSPHSTAPRPPLLVLSQVSRSYPSGDETIPALNAVSLTIRPGEFVAIVGQSGSGKSTLMNILGCLDRPTSGHYFIDGAPVDKAAADSLARLRREHFGFIFQRYHLLGDLDAQGNVEVPAIYAGLPRGKRRQKALHLLTRLGLKDRVHHKPTQLSGGQQQRVSIARALMNGGSIILADEPTGALDSRSGEDVITLLKQLNADGHTVIIVTHDPKLAAHCPRIVEFMDGQIVRDESTLNYDQERTLEGLGPTMAPTQTVNLRASFEDALRMSLLAIQGHKLRSFLTMLGIIIGIASVVSVVALGEGSRQQILQQMSSMGTSTIEVMAGRGLGDLNAGAIKSLSTRDADVIAESSYIDSATPNFSVGQTVKYAAKAKSVTVRGVGTQYFRANGLLVEKGRLINDRDVIDRSQAVVIDQNTRKSLKLPDNPIGLIVMLDKTPVSIVGLLKKEASPFSQSAQSMNMYMAYSSVSSRFTGEVAPQSLTIRVRDDVDMKQAEKAVEKTLSRRHGTKDFFLINNDQMRQSISSSMRVMTLFVSSIALISLVVGGIGVMNIMLVSVTERTSEIGVRMAVGARRWNIMLQFLIEAVLLCFTGGLVGISIAYLFTTLFNLIVPSMPVHISIPSIATAFGCCTVIGIVFGFLPARNAARLDPVTALARD